MFFFCFTFFCVEESFSFLAQWPNNPIIYIRSYRWNPHELSFIKIKIKTNLEASLGVFYSQNWIHLVVGIDSYFCKFVYLYIYIYYKLWVDLDMFRRRRRKKKFGGGSTKIHPPKWRAKVRKKRFTTWNLLFYPFYPQYFLSLFDVIRAWQ